MSSSLPTVADAVVIGGGIIGLCTAIHLARNGLTVVLLEKSFVGSGPTGRSLAVISQHYTHPAMVALAREGLEIFRNFEAHYGSGCGWTGAGLVVLVGPESAAPLRSTVEMQVQQGVRVELFDNSQLQSLDVRLHTADVGLASYQPTAGYADPQHTIHTLYRAALAEGVHVHEQTPAIDILSRGDRICGVATPHGMISTCVVVDTAGPWAHVVSSQIGLEIPIVSCRQTMAVLRRPIEFGDRHPIVNDFILGTSFRSDGNSTIIGRFDRSQTQHPTDPDAADGSVAGADIDHLSQLWIKRYPLGRRRVQVGGWSGLYDVTPDWIPICDRLGPEGFYVCCGTSGHGFKFGPVFGQYLANWIVDGSVGDRNIDRLSMQRFRQ
ncbi:MAG: FAD-dependent oxidoreductase [Cyanobacteria bacterium P01_E01_bin.34]